jgi:hypothetical protein
MPRAPITMDQVPEWIERIVMIPFRLRGRRQARAKTKARLQALATTHKTLKNARNLGAQGVADVFNAALYVILFDQDIADITDALLHTTGERRRRFFAKFEAMVMYEVLEDLQHILGGTFHQALDGLGVPEPAVRRLKDAKKALSSFWISEQDFLSGVRNGLTAHRETDALTYIRQLEELKPLEVMKRAADLSSLLSALIRSFTDIAIHCVGPATILRDMSASRKRPASGAVGGPSKRRRTRRA